MAKKGVVRNPSGRGGFKKGESGNPGGRSKKQTDIENAARAVLENNGRNLALEVLAEIAQGGERDNDRVRAIELLMSYGYGKPRTKIDLSADPTAQGSAVMFYIPRNGREAPQ